MQAGWSLHQGGGAAILYIDSHEDIALELLLAQCLNVERTNLNPERPDLYWVGYDGKQIGIELKQAGEALGSIDSVEEQLGREMKGCDYLGLGIRGVITPTTDGFCQVWLPGATNPHIMVAGRVFKQSYIGYRAWLSRLQELGVLVIEVPNVEALSHAVVALYNLSQKPGSDHKTFMRLIPEQYWLSEQDERKRDLALTLMGIRPKCGLGEEAALAIAERFPDLATLVNTLEAGGDKEIAKLPLRSGKRSIGPAAVAGLRKAVGL